MKVLAKIIACLSAAMLFSASMALAQDNSAVTAQPAPAQSTGYSAEDSVTYQYRLGAGDQVRVSVFGEDDLGGVFTVSGEGKLALPLVGDLLVVGKTVAEVQDAAANLYKQGYLKDPRVTIEVLNFRPFYILGEVNKPGQYPYNNGMTVVNAVALASGFTYRADKKSVFIKHANDTRETKVALTSDLTVAPGDTVRIAERYF